MVDKTKPTQRPWYKKPWGIVAAIIFWPIFLTWYAWAKSKWVKPVRIAATVVGVVVLIGLMGASSSPQTNTQTNQVRVTPKATDSVSNAAQKQQADQIIVQSSIIKKVSKKYRYFFDVQNASGSAVPGKVTVVLVSEDGAFKMPLEFNLDNLGSQLHKQGYIDLNTGNTAEFGSSRITKFTYSVELGGAKFSYPERPVTDKFEDLTGL